MDISKLLDGGGDSESEEEEEVESEQDSSEEVDSKLQNLLSNLSSKRSLEEDESSTLEPSKKARHVLSERTESMPESEYASGTSNQQLRLEDLLDPLNGQSGLSSLRNSTRALGNGGEKTAIASKRGGGALSAPLASIIQDKLDRKAAYELTKEEVEGWKPTIKRLREAEHLSFPLQETKLDQTSTASLTANFKAQKGGLEDEIERMLMESGMTERQLKEEEELKMKELDPKEVKRRREELKKMRELMFRAEIKAKRISKIKSKAFRKIARKEKERERKKLEEAGLLGDEEDGEMDEESRMKKERDRAMERATLKHKNTSKWAKNSLGRNHQTQESRNAIEDQLRRGEELRRKIHGLNSDSEDEEEDEDEEFDSDGDRIDNDREKAFDELKSLEEREEKKRFKDEIELDGKHKNVMNMKFMKDARKKNEARNRGEMDEFRIKWKRWERILVNLKMKRKIKSMAWEARGTSVPMVEEPFMELVELKLKLRILSLWRNPLKVLVILLLQLFKLLTTHSWVETTRRRPSRTNHLNWQGRKVWEPSFSTVHRIPTQQLILGWSRLPKVQLNPRRRIKS